MGVQRFPVQDGIDLINNTGDVKSSIIFQAGIPDTAIADSMLSPSWWFDTSGGGVYWKKESGAGFDKWAKVAEEEVKLAERLDFVITGSGAGEITTLYVGRAATGSVDSAAVWSVSRSVIESGLDNDTVTTWADGNADFDNIWDDRLTLTYV